MYQLYNFILNTAITQITSHQLILTNMHTENNVSQLLISVNICLVQRAITLNKSLKMQKIDIKQHSVAVFGLIFEIKQI